MTFNSTYYTGVVINDFASIGAASYDSAGSFDVVLPYREANLARWAGKTAYALKVESSYPAHLITDEGAYGPAPQGFELTETYLAANGASFLYLFEAPSTVHVDSPFDPVPMIFNEGVQYASDIEFRIPVYPDVPPATLWPYVYYLVLHTPTAMPSLSVLEASTLAYHQKVFVFDIMTPDATLADGTSHWALRLTVYVDGVVPPLRLFQRDDDLGKVASARMGGHTPVGNPPSSLQRQSAPRLVEGGNVYL